MAFLFTNESRALWDLGFLLLSSLGLLPLHLVVAILADILGHLPIVLVLLYLLGGLIQNRRMQFVNHLVSVLIDVVLWGMRGPVLRGTHIPQVMMSPRHRVLSLGLGKSRASHEIIWLNSCSVSLWNWWQLIVVIRGINGHYFGGRFSQGEDALFLLRGCGIDWGNHGQYFRRRHLLWRGQRWPDILFLYRYHLWSKGFVWLEHLNRLLV